MHFHRFLLVQFIITCDNKVLEQTSIDDKLKKALNLLAQADLHLNNITGTNFFSDGIIYPLEKKDPPLETIGFKHFEEGVVFAAVGQVNHKYTMDMEIVDSSLRRIDKQYISIKENSPEEYMDLERERDEVYNLVKHFCKPSVIKAKRLAITTAILITIISSLISTGAVTGVAFAAGGFGTAQPITEQVLFEEAEINLLELEKDQTWLNVTKNQHLFMTKLEDDVIHLQNLFTDLYSQVQDMKKAKYIKSSYEKIMKFLQRILSPQKWEYENNSLLNLAQETLAKTGLFKQGSLFGFNSVATLLLSSDILPTILFEEENDGSCSKVQIVNQFYTVIISTENVGLPTKNPVKYKVTEKKFMWISKEAFLRPSKFRPIKKISFQREIITDDTVEIHPHNNTIIVIISSQNEIDYEMSCPEMTKKGFLNTSSVINIAHECSLTSKFLNISTYKVIVIFHHLYLNIFNFRYT